MAADGGARLRAVPAGDDPKTRLGQHLLALFEGLGVSQRAYAHPRPYHNSLLSRYFSGQRVPPWAFIQALLDDLADHRGEPLTDQVRDHTRQLFLAALQAGSSTERHRYQLQALTDELDREARQARQREQDLLGRIHDQRQQIGDLTLQLDNLAGAYVSERDSLRRRIAELEEELSRLQDELRLVRDEREAAEADYGQCARALAVLEDEVIPHAREIVAAAERHAAEIIGEAERRRGQTVSTSTAARADATLQALVAEVIMMRYRARDLLFATGADRVTRKPTAMGAIKGLARSLERDINQAATWAAGHQLADLAEDLTAAAKHAAPLAQVKSIDELRYHRDGAHESHASELAIALIAIPVDASDVNLEELHLPTSMT